MSMYLISGNGSMPQKEIEAQLGDLINKAVNIDDLDCWFALHVTDTSANLTTHTAVINYLNKIEAYYEIWGPQSPDDSLYANAAETVLVQDDAVIKRLKKVASVEEGEVAILGLFVNFDFTNEPLDTVLNSQTIEALDNKMPVYALNHAMVSLDSTEDHEDISEELPPVAAKPEKATNKFDADVERYNNLSSVDEWSREELSGLTIEELRAICLHAPKKASKDEIIDILMGVSEYGIMAEEITVAEKAAPADTVDPVVEFLHALIEDAQRMLENLQKGS